MVFLYRDGLSDCRALVCLGQRLQQREMQEQQSRQLLCEGMHRENLVLSHPTLMQRLRRAAEKTQPGLVVLP